MKTDELTAAEYDERLREAAQLLRAGELQGAIQVQTRLVEILIEPGPKIVRVHETLTDQLERASGQLVDSLRWAGDYSPAIALQERLVEYLPELEESLRLSAANLRIESGEEAENGLAQFREMVARQPENFWYQVSLASAYLYLDRLDEAEQALRRATDIGQVRKIDRAIAFQYLYFLFQRQGKTDEALAAWREAARLDSSLRAEMLPDVCRMLIKWRKFPEAQKHIALDRVQVRKLFFQGLAAIGDDRPADAAAAWHKLLSSYNPVALKEGLDEFAEACLRLANPMGAILALEKRVDGGEVTYQRSVLLGLAYAQRGIIDRARRHLDIALRLGDLVRPRLTLPCATGRVLSTSARDLYSNILLDPNIRKKIEDYFVPKS